MLNTITAEKPKKTLKRKVGYMEEQTSATRPRQGDNMEIDKQIGGPGGKEGLSTNNN